jgi:biopolymer transport protein ExbD
MPKIKVPRSSPALDMTPMVDLAFLLVTFFMLTTQFRATEPVVVDQPASTSDKILPDNTMLITIDTAGKVFYNIAGREVRTAQLQDMATRYKIQFTDEEINRFAIMTSFGVPIDQLKGYIKLSEGEKAKFQSPGIPMDSLNNQLKDWILTGRIAAARHAQMLRSENPDDPAFRDYKDLRIAIKADGKADYQKVRKVMQVFEDQDVYRFNLITNLEAAE